MKRLTLFATAVLCAQAAAAQDGMVAARDPQTGLLRAATPAELRALGAPSLSLRPAAGPVKIRSDGRRELHLGEAALVHATIRRDADGRLTTSCVEGDDQAPAKEAAHADR
ncbi:MAG: hypothetical protein JWP59_256 [Massilia sp.]|jgi:hypothetical protein|nr:hypothetical protein [Massilia sp.]